MLTWWLEKHACGHWRTAGSVPPTLQESLGFGLLVGRFIDLINRAETIICWSPASLNCLNITEETLLFLKYRLHMKC